MRPVRRGPDVPIGSIATGIVVQASRLHHNAATRNPRHCSSPGIRLAEPRGGD